MVIITVLKMTDNIISKSATSEVSIKLKGEDDGLGDDDGSDDVAVIFVLFQT